MKQHYIVTTEEGASIVLEMADNVITVFSTTHELDVERDATNAFIINTGEKN